MKLVTNGKQWAVKKGWWIFTRYLDLQHPTLWWDPKAEYGAYYCTTSAWSTKERAEECMGYYKHKKVK